MKRLRRELKRWGQGHKNSVFSFNFYCIDLKKLAAKGEKNRKSFKATFETKWTRRFFGYLLFNSDVRI
jgi:hypothetical protein